MSQVPNNAVSAKAVRYGDATDGSCATKSKSITRYAWVTRLKPDKIEHYEYLHAHTWPAVNRMIKDCHIQNYSIYKREIEGKTCLFSYLEYSGDDFEADMKMMAADPETRRWWQETDPCQLPLPDAVAQGKIWSDAKEVFHLD
jgi:L-rhamnose mutarotase